MTKLAKEIVQHVKGLPHATTGEIRAVRQGYSKQIAAWEPKAVLALADELLSEDQFVYHFVATELVHYHRPTLTALKAKDLKPLGRRADSWYATDTFGPLVAGPAWREGQVPDSVIHTWAKSKNLWQRRTALTCTIALNTKARGGRGDTLRTLAVCQMLVNDREDMVVKALSWALRELAEHDPKAVKQFMAQYNEALAPRIKREVRNKLTTGLKNPK
jgi:3-methyladenine DNA glycosylase AlkD